ncbi:MAG: sulfatase-like hydrolase/transferase, partial [Deltaproteobacteria bacterium]|nr:sulfatase-like hydrolase/transferase [Deltaproteobacteria bacterium]
LDQQPTYSAWYALNIRPAPRHEGVLDLDLPDEPSFNEADITDKPPYLLDRPHLSEEDIENARAQYNGMAASMLAVDDLIGDVFDALVARGALEDTVVIFTSDNGYLLGRHLIPQKNAPYEESIRIPLYMRVPGFDKATTDRMVANNDLAPTFAELAGAEPTIPVDGRSLVPLIEDPERDNWRKRLLFEHWSMTGTSIEVPTFSAVRSGAGAPEGAGFIQVEYRSFFGVPTDTEFYEIATDPYQLDSAHDDAQYESVRGTLSEFVAALKDCVGDECRLWEDAQAPPDE